MSRDNIFDGVCQTVNQAVLDYMQLVNMNSGLPPIDGLALEGIKSIVNYTVVVMGSLAKQHDVMNNYTIVLTSFAGKES